MIVLRNGHAENGALRLAFRLFKHRVNEKARKASAAILFADADLPKEKRVVGFDAHHVADGGIAVFFINKKGILAVEGRHHPIGILRMYVQGRTVLRKVAQEGGVFFFCLANDKLVFHKSICPIIEGSYVVKYIEKIIYAKQITKKIEEEMNAEPRKAPSKLTMYMNNYMKKHFEVMLEDLRKINPDIKLIILVYRDKIEFYQDLPLWDDLEKEGIKVVKVT